MHDPTSAADGSPSAHEPHAASAPVPAAPFSASTGQLASALLKPVVRADEAREYVAWTTQFQHLSLAAHDHLSEKDRAMYTAHAAVAVPRAGCAEPRRSLAADGLADVSERDRATFQAFVSGARPRGATGGEVGVSGAAVKMYRDMVEGGGA